MPNASISPIATTPQKERYDNADSDYEEDQQSYTDDSVTENNAAEADLLKIKKFVVFEDQLDVLMKQLPCSQCAGTAVKLVKSYQGTCIRYKGYCCHEHEVINWNSQPLFGKMPAYI